MTLITMATGTGTGATAAPVPVSLVAVSLVSQDVSAGLAGLLVRT
jgi:hypothetical protein